jgi:hypothetical protein
MVITESSLEETAMRKHIFILGFIAIAMIVTLACSLSGTATATPDPGLFNTQVAMAMTQTAMSIPPQALQTATLGLPPTQDPSLLNTQVAMAMTQTAMSNPPAAVPTSTVGAPTNTPQPPASPTAQDIQSMIDSSNILVYEDIAGDSSYIPYVKRALESVGGFHKYVGDAMGTFMNELNSGTQWDLIISASELRTAISGDYWTVMKQKVDDGSALVSEIWYLDSINDGKIAPLMSECGLKLQSDWQAKAVYNPVDNGMVWVDSMNPVFNTPNRVAAFGASLSTTAAWMYGDMGDLVEVTDSSKGQILASHMIGQNSRYGLLSQCMGGRVLFQTFSSHNYPTNDMIALWENYIVYTLTNHFQVH